MNALCSCMRHRFLNAEPSCRRQCRQSLHFFTYFAIKYLKILNIQNIQTVKYFIEIFLPFLYSIKRLNKGSIFKLLYISYAIVMTGILLLKINLWYKKYIEKLLQLFTYPNIYDTFRKRTEEMKLRKNQSKNRENQTD